MENTEASNTNVNNNIVTLENYSNNYDKTLKIKCNVYGKSIKNSLSFLVDKQDFIIKMRESKGLLLSTVYKFQNDTQTFLGLFKEVQRHPVTDDPFHLDIHLLNENESIEMNLSVKFINKDICKGFKDGGLIRIHRRNFIIKFLPKNAINTIEIDMLNLKIGDSVSLEDLNLKNVEFQIGGTIVSVVAPRISKR